VPKQSALAHAGVALDDENPALTISNCIEQPCERAAVTGPANQIVERPSRSECLENVNAAERTADGTVEPGFSQSGITQIQCWIKNSRRSAEDLIFDPL
jgi:hypothetical protein